MNDAVAATVANAWMQHRAWSETASMLKRRVQMGQRWATALGLLGATLATGSAVSAGGQTDPYGHRLAAIASAVLLAIVPVILLRIAPRERIVAWLRARSASEALKEEIYRFLAGGPPYTDTRDVALLSRRCLIFTDAVSDLARYKAEAKTPRREPPPPVRDVDDYVVQRVDHQIESYYRRQAVTHARRAALFERLEIGTAVAAAVLGALGAFAGTAYHIEAWVAVATTAASAVAAHLAWERYSALAVIYQATADRLSALKAGFMDDASRHTPARIACFVDDCERAISSQNESWLAAWSRNPETR